VQARPRHQGSQPLHELQRRHHQVRGAVAPGRLQLQHDLPGGVALGAFVGQRRAGDGAAQLLQADDFGGIAVYLASAASGYTTGEQFVIDGGYTKF